jgi:ABC-2 type transport system ATP-binding protein
MASEAPIISSMKALSIRNLRKTYGNGVEALKGIDLDVEPGEFFGLLGPNGAGKTTAIGILFSLVNKTGGSASVFGHDIDTDFARAKACMGLVPQEFNFNVFEKVLHVVCNQAGYYGIEWPVAMGRAEKYLKQLGLWDRRDRPTRELSGGMKRRLMIARALMNEPKLLVLDEPTAGVDIELRRSMWQFLRDINATGTTIILTTHYLEEAESLCRRIAIIDHGSIVENTTTKSLLAKLHVETFILDLADPIAQPPAAEGYKFTRIDDTTLEVELTRHQPVNALFSLLSDRGIRVVSMRNKANRLEELFVRLVGNGKTA